jgi:hypothetical protein
MLRFVCAVNRGVARRCRVDSEDCGHNGTTKNCSTRDTEGDGECPMASEKLAKQVTNVWRVRIDCFAIEIPIEISLEGISGLVAAGRIFFQGAQRDEVKFAWNSEARA